METMLVYDARTSTVEDCAAALRAGYDQHPEFVKRALRAGCIGDVVWITGKHVTYFGRRGDTHVAHFPANT